jgi:hypothetical protein
MQALAAKVGGSGAGGLFAAGSVSDPNTPLPDISSHPDHVKVLQQLAEAQAAIAAARKRDRDASDDDDAHSSTAARQRQA